MGGPVTVRRRNPIKAWQVTADNAAQVAAWCGGRLLDDGSIMVGRPDDSVVCEFTEVGDWVIDPDPVAGTAAVLPDEHFKKHYGVIEP